MAGEAGDRIELSIVMPCLDEAAAVGACVDEALLFLGSCRLSGEVVVVDNGSSDGSAEEAKKHGARVLREERRGYGRAIRTGLSGSRGRVIVYGDCDGTYNFSHLEGLVMPLLEGRYDLMAGDRFAGGIERGAMSFLHRAGVWALSACGRCRYHVAVRDFHCGVRGLTREAFLKMTLKADGMEFATEIIAEAARKGLRIGEAPVSLRRSPFERKSKLRTFSDGWRHLRMLLRL